MNVFRNRGILTEEQFNKFLRMAGVKMGKEKKEEEAKIFKTTGDINHVQYSDQERQNIKDLLEKKKKGGIEARMSRKTLREDYMFYISLMTEEKEEEDELS